MIGTCMCSRGRRDQAIGALVCQRWHAEWMELQMNKLHESKNNKRSELPLYRHEFRLASRLLMLI